MNTSLVHRSYFWSVPFVLVCLISTGCNVKGIIGAFQAGMELGKNGGRPTPELIIAEIEKANKSLPRKIDPVTTLMKLDFEDPDQVTFRYEVSLPGLAPKWGNAESERLESEARRLAKGDAGVQMLLNMGLRLHHSYRTTKGRMLCAFEVGNEKCDQQFAAKEKSPEITPVNFQSMSPEKYVPPAHPDGGIQENPFFDSAPTIAKP